MFERFAKDAREAVMHAQDEARALGADRIGTEHVLLGAVRRARTPSPHGALQHARHRPPCACSPASGRCRRTRSTATRSPASASTSTPCARRSRRRSAPAPWTPSPNPRPARAATGRSTRTPRSCSRSRCVRRPLQAPQDRHRPPAARGRPARRHLGAPGARRARRVARRRPRGGRRRLGRRAGRLTVPADVTLARVLRTRAWSTPARRDHAAAGSGRACGPAGRGRSELGDRREPQQQPLGALGAEVDLGHRVRAGPLERDHRAEPVRVVRDAVADGQLRDRGVGPRRRGPERRARRGQRLARSPVPRGRGPVPAARTRPARAVARAVAAAQLLTSTTRAAASRSARPGRSSRNRLAGNSLGTPHAVRTAAREMYSRSRARVRPTYASRRSSASCSSPTATAGAGTCRPPCR